MRTEFTSQTWCTVRSIGTAACANAKFMKRNSGRLAGLGRPDPAADASNDTP